MKIARIVGVIHARGGSKRIPLKNIKPLSGTPLIGYMIRAAAAARRLHRVIVSTDHDEIGRIARDFGAEVPFRRPPEIARDCPSELVTQHAVRFVEEEQGEMVDIAVSMQPTTPFCRASDIDACVGLLQDHSEWDSVFSAKTVSERPEWMFRHDSGNGEATLFHGRVIQGETGVFQSLPALVTPNGGIYATRRRALFEDKLLIARRTGVHLMPREMSVDIDEPIDFEFAEFLARRGLVACTDG